MQYDIIMITTFIDRDRIHLLLGSVTRNNQSIDILVLVIDQTCGPTPFFSENPRVHLEWLRLPGPVPLSRARNAGFKRISELELKGTHIMFPDDDATFDEDFFRRYKQIAKSDTSYLITIYDEGTKKHFLSFPQTDGMALGPKHFELSASVNLMLTQAVCEKVGFFDEKLGVGAEFGSGEDRDYYLRACEHTAFLFTAQLHIFHPASAPLFAKMPMRALLQRYKSYSKGHIYLLFRHRLFWNAAKSVVRACVASVFLLASAQLKRSIVQFLMVFVRIGYCFLFMFRYREISRRSRGSQDDGLPSGPTNS